MLLSELSDYLLARSGQFILPGGLKSLRLSPKVVWSIVDPTIKEYGRYCPIFKKFNINTAGSTHYDFTDHEFGIPRKVFQALPVNSMNIISTMGYNQFTKDAGNPSRLVEPRVFIKLYRAPKVYFTESGSFDVTCSYPFVPVFTKDEDDLITEVEIPELGEEETHQIFLDMVYGLFLQSIGNARGSFIYTDFPVTTNAQDLLNQGKTIYDAARLELYKRNRWYLAIRA